jgi:tetratricopeptide (TPR) repeat protein
LLATLSLLLLSAQALTPEPEILERLQKAVDQGGYDSGLQLLKTIVEREPANVAARFFLATAYQTKQNYPACLETISGQSKYDDRAIGIWWVCLDESGQQEQALALAQEWLKEFPQSAELHRWHGVSLSRQWKERSAEARHEFRTALQLDPHDTTALYMLAQHFRSAGLILPSLFTYLRFLVEEPAGRRADKARDQLRILLSSNLVTTPTDKGPTEIRLSLGESSSQKKAIYQPPNKRSPSGSHPTIKARN